MTKKIIDHVMAGLAIAFIITNITMYIFLRDITGEQAILSYIIWMCAGVLYGVISLIHDTSLSKPAAAAVHYILNLLLSFGAFFLMYNLVLCREMEFSILWPVVVFTLVYILVGTCNYLYNKVSVNVLNKKLSKNKTV